MKLKSLLLFTFTVILFVGVVFAQELSNGISKESVESILGRPDMVTTRDDLQAQIYPVIIDVDRHDKEFEFWIYYQHPDGKKNWGFVEFNTDREVVDFSIHTPGQRSKYLLEMSSPGADIFKKIGHYNGDDWNLMPDKSKTLLIIEIMDNLRGKNVFINRHPFYYLEELDFFFKEDAYGHFTVINTLYTFALLSRDWDDGLDKDERIKRTLPTDIWSDFIR
ncbi:MAG: hypothetical protein P9X27_02000 [Candidatus Kaelpia aquatica]|nr:hypothetical protein [Candidatus Kaelpia aquatica]